MNHQFYGSTVTNDSLFAQLPGVRRTYTRRTNPAQEPTKEPAQREPSGSSLFLTQDAVLLDGIDKDLLGGRSSAGPQSSSPADVNPESTFSIPPERPQSNSRNEKTPIHTRQSAARSPQDPDCVLSTAETRNAPTTIRSRKKRRAPVEGLSLVNELPIRELSLEALKSCKTSTEHVRTNQSRRSSFKLKDFSFPPKTPTVANRQPWTPGSVFEGLRFDEAESKNRPSSITCRATHRRSRRSSLFSSRAIVPRPLKLATKLPLTTSTEAPSTTDTAQAPREAIFHGSLRGTQQVKARTCPQSSSRPPSTSSTDRLPIRMALQAVDVSPSIAKVPRTAEQISNRPSTSRTVRGPSKSERGSWLKRKKVNFVPEEYFDTEFFAEISQGQVPGKISSILQDAVPKLTEVIVASQTPNTVLEKPERRKLTWTTFSSSPTGIAEPSLDLTKDSQASTRAKVQETKTTEKAPGNDPEDSAAVSGSAHIILGPDIEARKYFSNAVELLSSSAKGSQRFNATKPCHSRTQRPSLQRVGHEFGVSPGAEHLRNERHASEARGNLAIGVTSRLKRKISALLFNPPFKDPL